MTGLAARLTPKDGGALVVIDETMEGWLVAVLKVLMPHFLAKALRVWGDSLKERVEHERGNPLAGSAGRRRTPT